MKSIFSRLILSFLAIVLISIVSLSTFFSGLLKDYFMEQKERELKNKGNQINQIAGQFLRGQISENTFSYVLNTIDQVADSRTLVVNTSGIIMNNPFLYIGPGPINPLKGSKFNDEDFLEVLKGATVVKKAYSSYFNEPMITVGTPVYLDSAKTIIIGAIILNSPVTGVTDAVNKMRNMLTFASLGALMFSLMASFFLSKTISSPIRLISRAALEIAEGDYSKKVAIHRSDEIGTLASAFNYLTEKLNDVMGDLSNEKRKLLDILYSMEEGLIAVDKNFKVIHINPAAKSLLNIEEPCTKKLSDMEDEGSIAHNSRFVLDNGKSVSYEWSISQSKIVNVLISPLKYQNDEVYGAIILLQDISESVKLEKMRKDFVANVSHELRTPLTSIRGFIEPLIDGTVDDHETRLKYLRIIRDETVRLERLISDLLDLSRLQTGKVPLDIQRVDIAELIWNVSAKFQPLFNSKDINFKFDKPSEPIFILADGDRVEQLMVIFLDNAVKFTPACGRIEVKLAAEEELARISIKDSGPGIPEEDIPFIWDRFYKVDKSRTGKDSGTGLGLSIAKNIIELHGQKASVESKLGEGTTFEFTMKRDV